MAKKNIATCVGSEPRPSSSLSSYTESSRLIVVGGTGLHVLCRKRLSCHTRHEQQVTLCHVLNCVLGYGMVLYARKKVFLPISGILNL